MLDPGIFRGGHEGIAVNSFRHKKIMTLLGKEVLIKIRARNFGNTVRAGVILHDWA
jgi:hypothetical protein